MGILIEDTITLDNGLTCANTYGSLGTSHIIIEKVEEILTMESEKYRQQLLEQ